MGRLRPGERLLLADGSEAVVATLQREYAPVIFENWTPGQAATGTLGTPADPTTGTFTTYNFEVADWHTYFAAGIGAAVWVHNDGRLCPIGLDRAADTYNELKPERRQAYLDKLSAKGVPQAQLDEIQWRNLEYHHSDPKFMGGAKKQPLTGMSPGRHDDLHRDLNDFLRTKENTAGDHMRPQRGNPGVDIRTNFSPQERLDALAEFYRSNSDKYKDAARDFFRQHPGLNR